MAWLTVRLRSMADRSELEAAWLSERRPMISAVYRRCGDRDVAAEVVDEAFANVIARLRRASIEDVRSYLWRAVFNEVRRSGRARLRAAETAERAAVQTSTCVAGPEEAEPQSDLVKSLGRLDRRTQVVLVLRFFGDLTVPQIARRLSLPLGTVKSLIHRGMAALRDGYDRI